MSRLYKILLGVFCGGILLCGIGTGIAVTEFSNLEYGGVKFLGGQKMKMESLDVELEAQEEPWRILIYGPSGSRIEPELDESLPENTVRVQVTYNAEQLQPSLYCQESYVGLHWSRSQTDELALMMEAKDEILQDLKQGRVSSYETKRIESIKVFVNPADEKVIQMN